MPAVYQSDPIDFPNKLGGEGADVGVDEGSGAMVRRLTSGPLANHLIYCEQPYASPDGKRIAIIRGRDFTFENDFSLLISDVDALTLTRVERSIPRNLVHQNWGEWLYYRTHEGAMRRVSMLTLAKESVLPDGAVPANLDLLSITPDGQTVFAVNPTRVTAPPVLAIDTRTGKMSEVFSHPDNLNAHLQVEPTRGKQFLMQLLAGSGRGPDGVPGKLTGVPLFVMNADGTNVRKLALGGVHSAESSGHMAWITGRDRVACCLDWNRESRTHDARHPQGNLGIVSPGDSKPQIFAAPEHGFYHVSVSRCGRYFVCDDFMDFQADAFRSRIGPIRIVVGCFDTGKYRVLVRDCLALGIAGSSNWEPVPYFTADNRYVIFNSSPHGTNQVFAAAVPADFLKSLD